MTDIRNIVVLTGAGISAESGVPTFRGPDGLWEGHRVEDVATPEAFRRDPDLVLDFYDKRRAALATVEPNAAHTALGRLDAAWEGALLIVTQNVDDLHERGGAGRLLHMHGELKSGWCLYCDRRMPFDGTMRSRPACPSCGEAGRIRPDVVVYPAAGFVQTAKYCGARTLELNLDPSEGSHLFDESRMGPAGELVPAWVEEVLAGR
ncbi:MAG: NAD-dependent deacylase [Sphingomonadales bacterium]|nr:NAD-dependent deacylase [Sphingomonadales bacterium]